MADLASTDVTYVIKHQAAAGSDGKVVHAKLTFGDGSLNYPSGGVPILKGSLGLPNSINGLSIDEMSAGVTTLWKWDQSASTLRGYTASGTSAELASAVAAQEIHVTVQGW